MYAVISADGTVRYLGDDLYQADKCAENAKDWVRFEVESLEDLKVTIVAHQIEVMAQSFAEGLTDAAQKVLDKLNATGLNAENAEQLGATIREKGERAAAEVRSLGIQSMRVVGDSFINLGELLKIADEDKDREEND